MSGFREEVLSLALLKIMVAALDLQQQLLMCLVLYGDGWKLCSVLTRELRGTLKFLY